jgi:hypothetical protein
VTAHFGSDISGLPLRVPAPPVDEPGRVVEVVAVERVAPVDDGGDICSQREHVAIGQVAVNDVTLFRQALDETLQSGVGLVERAQADG